MTFLSGSSTYIANIPSLIWSNTGHTVDLISTGTYYVVDKLSNLPYTFPNDSSYTPLSADDIIKRITNTTGATIQLLDVTPIISATDKQTAIAQVF